MSKKKTRASLDRANEIRRMNTQERRRQMIKETLARLAAAKPGGETLALDPVELTRRDNEERESLMGALRAR